MALVKKGLGRGLDTIMPMDDVPARGASTISEIPLSQIHPNPDQPRTSFDNEALDELAASIRQIGIVQPISLRKVAPDSYQIIAGERRYRAALAAGLLTVPAYIRTASESELTEMALIENIQREDLNAIEIALTFKKLIDQYDLTQERLSERIGKKRATVANFLRLLKLPAEVQLGLRDKKVDMGHARALLSIESPADQLRIYERIVAEGLSVRAVENLAKELREGDSVPQSPKTPRKMPSAEFDLLRQHLSATFNTSVQFSCNASGKGKIAFTFRDVDELERLISIFDGLKPTN